MTAIYGRRVTLKYLILFLLMAVFQSDSCLAAKAPKAAIVYMEDYHFSPTTLVIAPGQKVIWINKGKKVHTVTSSDGYFNSGSVRPGASVSYTFNKPGIYHYYCKPHTFLFFGMKGEVIVK